jgi:hypothetical protein
MHDTAAMSSVNAPFIAVCRCTKMTDMVSSNSDTTRGMVQDAWIDCPNYSFELAFLETTMYQNPLAYFAQQDVSSHNTTNLFFKFAAIL